MLRRFLLVLTAATATAVAPAAVRAQERAAALDRPPSVLERADRVPPAEVEPAEAGADGGQPSPASRDRSGWGTFGGHVGFFTGTALTAVLIGAALEDPALKPWVGFAGLFGTAGLTALGAWRVSVWAESGDWDPMVGWGFAGVLPGMAAGTVVAGSAVMIADANTRLSTRLAALGVGLGAGALAGYLGFRAMAEDRGSAGWEVFSFWVGFLLSEVCALSVLAGAGEDGPRAGVAMLGIPAGAVLSTAVVHLLLR